VPRNKEGVNGWPEKRGQAHAGNIVLPGVAVWVCEVWLPMVQSLLHLLVDLLVG
jgi:hypothetical protein